MRLRQAKSLLPTYDVFDEERYFDPAQKCADPRSKGRSSGLHVCEDAWNDPELWPTGASTTCDPVARLAEQGADAADQHLRLAVQLGKEEIRYRLISRPRRARTALPFVYVNQVGGNDELVFDGAQPRCCDARGKPVWRCCRPFEEAVVTVDRTRRPPGPDTTRRRTRSPRCTTPWCWASATTCASAAFARRSSGLSGGIDSARDLLPGVPRPWAARTCWASHALALLLRGQRRRLARPGRQPGHRVPRRSPSAASTTAYLEALAATFRRAAPDVTEENIQARIRGNILMALSNKFGHLLLTTGNKSELAVGYCTLYGDMSGGLAVISDVPKTMVYELARYINRDREIIPPAIITRRPRPSCAQPDGPGHPAALRDAGRGSCSCTSRRAAATRRSSRRASTRDGALGGAHGRPQRVQAAAGRAGPAGDHQGLRRGPAHAHRRQIRAGHLTSNI